jgi:hypothetical protein
MANTHLGEASGVVNDALSRRRALVLATGAFGVSVIAGCAPVTPSLRGNRIVSPPSEQPVDQQLKPRAWKTTTVRIGSDFAAVPSLDSLQTLQLPRLQIPFITRMTFHAPAEAPLVMIGLYYDRDDQNRPVMDLMTGGTFGLLRITDPDSPLTADSGQVESVAAANVSAAELSWFEDNRVNMVNGLKTCAKGLTLGQSFDCNFTTRARPPAGTPAALVLTGGKYQGADVSFTVFAQQFVFID